MSGCSSEPQYRNLDKIPRSQTSLDDLIDLVVVVLYVGEIRTIKHEDVKDKVRDILVADQSLNRPMKISAWNQSAEHDASFFQSWPEDFPVVGFCGIQPVTYRGLSLKTSQSTEFVENLVGEVENAVQTWVQGNKRLLEDWRGKAILIINDSADKTPIPLVTMGKEKANSIWQDEKFWIQASMSSLEAKEIYSYTGCNKCGKSVAENLGTKFVCSSCHIQDAVAVTRALINTVANDKTGSLKLTAFTNEVELIVGFKVEEISVLKKSVNIVEFEKKIAGLKKKEMLLHIAPTNALFINNVLK